MSDDRLLAALRRLSGEDLPVASDRAIRARLETAWTARTRMVKAPRINIRRFAAVIPAFVLVAGFGGTALGATADSPFWDTRVALESAAASLRLSNEDRVAYLLDLVQSRTEEAARQDAAGHPAAAAKARIAASAAVVQLGGNIPRLDTTVVVPTPSPARSGSPTASAATSPSPSRTPSGSVSPAVPLPPTRTALPTPVPTVSPPRTESLRPTTPVPTRSASPAPTATKQPVTIAGAVHDASGANVTGACISTSSQIPTSTTQCIYKTTNGSYGFSATTTTGQVITLYAYWTSPTGDSFAGSATGTIQAPTTVMPTITLTLRK